MIPGLKNKLFFHQSFQASIIHRFLKNSIPHGQARLPWTINERSEQDLQSQIETQGSPEAPTNESIRDILSQIEIFETLNDEELTNLINQSALEFFIVNEHIFHQRVKEDYSLHILLSGYADAYQINDDHYRVNVDKFKAGHYFGLQSFLLDVPHRISVLAKSPLWCIKIPRAVLSPLLEKYPQITESLGQLLAERKNESNQAIEEYKQANQAQNESTSEMFARKIKALFK